MIQFQVNEDALKLIRREQRLEELKRGPVVSYQFTKSIFAKLFQVWSIFATSLKRNRYPLGRCIKREKVLVLHFPPSLAKLDPLSENWVASPFENLAATFRAVGNPTRHLNNLNYVAEPTATNSGTNISHFANGISTIFLFHISGTPS